MRRAAYLGLVGWIGFSAGAWADGLAIKLVSITRPVHPGETVELVVQARPGATCEGVRQGHNGDEYAIKLPAKAIGADGRAEWQWSVQPGRHPIGLRGVRVTCTAGGQKAGLETTFDVE
ncbi:MAG TPA: hypothetical protein VMH36_18280 [Alphaproteobacteria bacterium]|nr:hypothetical protein [Alphaproteobacteria bacterium]